MAFELPELPYATHALEPYIDVTTMEVHHGKHHQGYINNLNKAIAGTEIANQAIKVILKNVSKYSPAIRNNGGGHFNHELFWPTLAPDSSRQPEGILADAIKNRFGSLNQFKEEFALAAATCFGSGWTWLCVDDRGELFICTTPNQDNPLMDVIEPQYRGTPILGLDVWEHAYYLQYQNRRPDYIAAFWHIVNWTVVAKRFQEARQL